LFPALSIGRKETRKDTYQICAGLEEDLGRRQARRKEDYSTALTALRSSARPKLRSFLCPFPHGRGLENDRTFGLADDHSETLATGGDDLSA